MNIAGVIRSEVREKVTLIKGDLFSIPVTSTEHAALVGIGEDDVFFDVAIGVVLFSGFGQGIALHGAERIVIGVKAILTVLTTVTPVAVAVTEVVTAGAADIFAAGMRLRNIEGAFISVFDNFSTVGSDDLSEAFVIVVSTFCFFFVVYFNVVGTVLAST